MADLGAIGELVPGDSVYPLARNARGLDVTANPIGCIPVFSGIALPFPEDYLHLSGSVADVAGDPAARTLIALSAQFRVIHVGASGVDGTFSFAVPAGVYRLIASGEPDRNDVIVAGVEPV